MRTLRQSLNRSARVGYFDGGPGVLTIIATADQLKADFGDWVKDKKGHFDISELRRYFSLVTVDETFRFYRVGLIAATKKEAIDIVLTHGLDNNYSLCHYRSIPSGTAYEEASEDMSDMETDDDDSDDDERGKTPRP